jgi:predicted PurR-regulated permease PerM
MGIPGIILAPVMLSFIKVEMTKYQVGPGGEVTEISRGV